MATAGSTAHKNQILAGVSGFFDLHKKGYKEHLKTASFKVTDNTSEQLQRNIELLAKQQPVLNKEISRYSALTISIVESTLLMMLKATKMCL